MVPVLRLISWAMLLLLSHTAVAEVLPDTKPLEAEGDLASEMVDGIHRFLDRETAESIDGRAAFWKRDTSSPEAYAASVAENRARFAAVIGVVDERVPFSGPELIATTAQPSLVGRGEGYEIHAVRWPVLAGVDAEGLLLTPVGKKAVADVVALPDADQTPEMIAGLADGIPAASQFARRLAESGCRVIVPVLIDRADPYSITRVGRATNQPHREFVYRPAFEMGRHIIGYEVQKVLAAVDWFSREAGSDEAAKIGVIGYGEGGLLALYAGAVDPRIDAVCTSGYFASRQGVWEEPIYRNVFTLLREFGDAEIASLVAPRALVVEASKHPELTGPPPARDGRSGAAPGAIETPPAAEVEKELERARSLVQGLMPPARMQMTQSDDGSGFITDETVTAFLGALVPGAEPAQEPAKIERLVKEVDPQPRLKRQLEQLLEHTQHLMRISPTVRDEFWSKADRSSVEAWEQSTEQYRTHFYDEIIGRFEHPLLPPNARTRKVYDEPKYTGYEVVLDVFPDVFAYGILLVPKDVKEGDRRPVVVCQHGLEGRPQDVADPKIDNPSYNQYAIRLAERGFVTYAPQNPYIFKDRFRSLQRKLNPLGKTLFSVIVPQHQQTVDWLATLPFVDPDRIAFYGLSYGGKTAMRVPPLVKEYALSICSADFNEWIWKNVSLDWIGTYIGTGEYEIFEWNLGNTYNYAEMAGLIAPRPFMVERGHHDAVAPDEWVAYEYAKVRFLYANLGIPDRTTIEFFDGPHTINGKGTFDFLHEKLNWPGPEENPGASGDVEEVNR